MNRMKKPALLVASLTFLALNACSSVTEKAVLSAVEHGAEALVCEGLKSIEGLPEGIDASVCPVANDPKATAANEAAVRSAVEVTTKAAPKNLINSTVYRDGKVAGKFTNRRAIMAVTFPVSSAAPSAPASSVSASTPAKAVIPPASLK